MDNPRPDKVAVVEAVKAQLADADAAVLTEYRGINVSELASLRRSLRDVGGEYRVYKNTLVRIATRELGLELDDLLTGPTAIAFVRTGAGDPVAVAKALREFAKGNPNLVVKGGILGESRLDADEVKALAEVAPREELLARLAGLMAAPMQQFAGLLQAVPRDFAYGLAALIAEGGAPGAPASVSEALAAAEEPAPTDTAVDAPVDETVADAPAAADDTPAEAPADAPDSAEAIASTDTAPAEAPADAPDPAEAIASTDTAPAEAGDDTQES
ncbi:MAG: 50S ribosomal protein L10 [Acidimicrobiales bacterium]|jgi:large subunit ribosomal protein L10|nr:50S ribosomal protein L10 [Acidimicrobiales bacterium]